MTTTYKQISELMGVTEGDARSFVNCISHFMAKGFSLEQAISKHMEIMKSLVNNSVKIANSAAAKNIAISTFYGV